ncbi:MAG: hypothetical protein FD141_1571 [Fusobacteria bacterium]|nr:MAG: hypothetical protein FD141_1571 [Fusobacteriota bacterium]KAF0230284.1 MAG: hypothetical protein FD182_674 [Fusobacteriota bacterium]
MKKKTLRLIAEDAFLKTEIWDKPKLEGLSLEEIGLIIHNLEVKKMNLKCKMMNFKELKQI